MRISELSGRSGIPVATIKFYLRENLLPDGVLTSATQAQYDESHVARLQLIRALTGPGGLSVAKTRMSWIRSTIRRSLTNDLLGAAHDAVARPPQTEPDLDTVNASLTALGWVVDENNAELRSELAAALAAIQSADFALPDGALRATPPRCWMWRRWRSSICRPSRSRLQFAMSCWAPCWSSR